MIGVGRRKNENFLMFLFSELTRHHPENETNKRAMPNEKRNLYELVTMSKVNVIYQQQQQRQ